LRKACFSGAGSRSGVAECASLLGCDAAVASTPCHIPAVLHLQLCAWS